MKKSVYLILTLVLFTFMATSNASYENTCQLTGELVSDPQIRIVSISRYDDNNQPKPDFEESIFELDVLVTKSKEAKGRIDSGCSLNAPYTLSLEIPKAYELTNAKKGDTIIFIEKLRNDKGHPETSKEYKLISFSVK